MKIDPIIINMPDIKGQNDIQANNRSDVPGQASSRMNNDTSSPDADDPITIQTGRQTGKQADRQADRTNASSKTALFDLKGVIALDDDKNVVIRFVDKKGKIVQQYPPEEYIQMMKTLNQVAESLFSKKA